ncbi:MAG TPA: T9SS type A sorting domain-containing protein [Rubricoccaceae bacterium]
MTPRYTLDRRHFCRLGGAAAGSLLLSPLAAHAALFPSGTTSADLTFGLVVSTSADFAPGTLLVSLTGLPEPYHSVGGLQARTTYHWRVNATDGTTTTPWSETFTFTTGAAVGTEEDAAAVFELGANYPNPFQSVTRIPFSVAEPGRVTIEVYNLLGQRVLTVLDEDRAAGRHEVAWDAGDLASGTYVYTLQTATQRAARRMVLVK